MSLPTFIIVFYRGRNATGGVVREQLWMDSKESARKHAEHVVWETGKAGSYRIRKPAKQNPYLGKHGLPHKAHPMLGLSKEQVRATKEHLQKLQEARASGYKGSFTTDPKWLVEQAINRRGGYADDSGGRRGSAIPVRGKFPKKGGGDLEADLRRISRDVNTPRLRVYEQRLGSWRKELTKRLPHRFVKPGEEYDNPRRRNPPKKPLPTFQAAYGHATFHKAAHDDYKAMTTSTGGKEYGFHPVETQGWLAHGVAAKLWSDVEDLLRARNAGWAPPTDTKLRAAVKKAEKASASARAVDEKYLKARAESARIRDRMRRV